MGAFDAQDFMRQIAARGLENQQVNPGDCVDKEGFLVCGVCKEHRQHNIELPTVTPDGQDTTITMKVACMCRCEREKEAEEKRREQARKDMERVDRLKKASLMDEKFRGARFSEFQVTKYNARNLKLCQRYVSGFDEMMEKNQGLIFWGDVGTGKSYAAACIANELLSKGIPVVMTSLVKILEIVQSGDEKESNIISRLNSARLVIFDDLGAERNTDYALEKIYNIIDSRYRSKKPMLLTTNLTIDEMKQETDRRYSRIYDRIFEVCYPMQFAGQSWRKKAANQRFKEMEALLGEGEGVPGDGRR